MPSKNPPLPPPCLSDLRALGERLRATRKRLGLSAVVVAESAQLSRATLQRVEAGEPAVTLGSYLAVMHTLGLSLADMAPPRPASATEENIALADFPQLRALAWHIPGLARVTRAEARGIYERHWRHLAADGLTADERRFMQSLGLEPPHV